MPTRPCPCGCTATLARGARCLRKRLERRIGTLTKRLDRLRENRNTKGFRTTWLAREELRDQLAALPTPPAAEPTKTITPPQKHFRQHKRPT